jgi:Uma2 family endonuclease
MATPRERRDALYIELEALPEHVTGEIIAGELVVSPGQGGDHAEALTEVVAQLWPAFAWRKGGLAVLRPWFLTMKSELHLDDDVLVPDLAGWYADRLGDIRGLIAVTLSPDWVCEILSPSTAKRDRGLKADRYAKHGVRWLWLVDPVEEFIEAFELVGQRWTRLGVWGGDDVASIVPFDRLPLELCRWWGREPREEGSAEASEAGAAVDAVVAGGGIVAEATAEASGDSDGQGGGRLGG